jgi:RNA recognition motif-containing protein
METDTTQTKIFIGGLSYQTSSERLREIFAKYGEMIEVRKPIFGLYARALLSAMLLCHGAAC